MRKTFVGIVVSTKMQKTVVVQIERKIRHPVYRKVIVRHKRFKAHNELSDIKEGDTVTIRETNPISKDKHYIVIEKVAKK